MFIEFIDKDGDTLALHINQIVGFEFKENAPAKILLSTGKIAELQDPVEIVKAKLAEVSKHCGVQLYWEFTPVKVFADAPVGTPENTTGNFPVVPSP